MYSFNDLGLMALFGAAFTAVYFLYEKILTNRAFSFLTTKEYILDSVSGTVFGLFTLLFKVILTSIDGEFNVPLFIIVALVLLVIKNVNVSVFAFIIPFIYYAVETSNIDIAYFLIASYVITSFAFILFEYFLDVKYAKLALLIMLVIISTLGIAIIHYGLLVDVNRLLLESSLFIAPLTLITYYLIRTAINVSLSANVLFESVNYVFSNYYRHPLAADVIGNEVKEKKISRALFGIFEIKMDERFSYEARKEVKETVLLKFEKSISDDVVLFAYDEYKFGFFAPVNDKYNPLENYENRNIKSINTMEESINDLNTTYKTHEGFDVSVIVKSGVSVYGLQSNSIEQLENNSLFALMEIDNDQTINLFNSSNYRKRVIDSRNVSLMDKNINLGMFSNKYIPTLSKELDDEFIYVIVEKDEHHEASQEVDELVRMNGWKETFDRYFSVESLKKNRNIESTLMIEYSPIVTSESFDKEVFKKRLKKMKLNISKIVWVLSVEDIINAKNKLIDIVDDEFRIAIKVKDQEWNNNKYNPELIIINNEYNHPLKEENKYINPFVTTEGELEKALNIGVDYIGGKVFEINSIAKKANKQSKIYIEDIMSRLEGKK